MIPIDHSKDINLRDLKGPHCARALGSALISQALPALDKTIWTIRELDFNTGHTSRSAEHRNVSIQDQQALLVAC